MTDRELLELAAKAVGIELNGASLAPIYMGEDGQWVSWNPLSDDGAALRLALQLHMNIDASFSHSVEASILIDDGMERVSAEESGPDMSAATRHAIVRAAAEIGKAIP
jgi:hypothetical protein